MRGYIEEMTINGVHCGIETTPEGYRSWSGGCGLGVPERTIEGARRTILIYHETRLEREIKQFKHQVKRAERALRKVQTKSSARRLKGDY